MVRLHRNTPRAYCHGAIGRRVAVGAGRLPNMFEKGGHDGPTRMHSSGLVFGTQYGLLGLGHTDQRHGEGGLSFFDNIDILIRVFSPDVFIPGQSDAYRYLGTVHQQILMWFPLLLSILFLTILFWGPERSPTTLLTIFHGVPSAGLGIPWTAFRFLSRSACRRFSRASVKPGSSCVAL